MKTQYVFDVYSSKGLEEVTCETCYKPLWQVRQELEQKYKEVNNIKGSVIATVTAICNIMPYTDNVDFTF